MKAITYYTSGEHLDRLCGQFGHQLDKLDREQKLELRIVLTYFIWGQEQLGENYSINDAWIDSLQHLLCEDEQIIECLEILQGISVKDAESLLIALQAQCTQGNARLKTPIETLTDDLVVRGVGCDLARNAAYIIHKVDGNRERSKDEQSAIDSVHQILSGVNIFKNEAINTIKHQYCKDFDISRECDICYRLETSRQDFDCSNIRSSGVAGWIRERAFNEFQQAGNARNIDIDLASRSFRRSKNLEAIADLLDGGEGSFNFYDETP